VGLAQLDLSSLNNYLNVEIFYSCKLVEIINN
jgi:hypothetical protein